ncbi:MAG: tandem-95 repeat protein, partial [Hormoscilla sp. GM102CHS1]|nr:tandem-95 repeat protein [Hormoscilla sp. GM102CHS1]
MTWNLDRNDQLSAMTDQLTDEARIINSLNATKRIADDENEYVDELNTDANDNIDVLTDRIICQCLLGFTSHNVTNLTEEIVARYKARKDNVRRYVDHIIVYLRMLIGFISREPDLLEMVLGTTGIINVFANDTDGNGDDLSITGFSLTSSQGVMIAGDDNNGLRYTSADGFRGTDSFEYSISDGNGGIDSATVTITVPNKAPEAGNDSATVSLGTTGIIEVLANDSDDNNDVLEITRFSLTSSGGVTITRDGNSLHYTPADGFRGTDSFEYIISDSNGGIDSATVTITVPNVAPSAVNDSAIVELGSIGTINVLENDSDGNGDNLSVTGMTATSSQGGTIAREGNNSLRYTPAGGFRGTDSFEYSIEDDNGGTSSATVTITVPNKAPEAGNDSATVSLGTTGIIEVLANDSDDN